MSDLIIATKQTTASLIAAAEQAYNWTGVFPAACLPGIAPLTEGALSQTKDQMVRDFKRHKNGLVGIQSGSNGIAILMRRVPVRDDLPSELAKRFFDPDRFLVTRTKTVNLRGGRVSLVDTVIIKSRFSFPCGMSTNDPSVVLVPDGSWALFATDHERVIGYRNLGLAISIQQINGGTFANREILKLSSHDCASLFSRGAK